MKTKEWLKNRRIKHSLTESQLAKKIGVNIEDISNIEDGYTLGSVETWEKIEEYLIDDGDKYYTYECNELIEELKNDILEFGEDHDCILVYKIIDDTIIFVNYDFICEEDPFNPEKELNEGEHYFISTFGYALEVFERQNRLF